MTGSTIRASDAERDAVAERLRVAYGEGRLSAEEFSDRLERVLSARTRGELTGPVDDLPAAPSRPLAPLDDPAGAVPVPRGDAVQQWAAWGGVSGVCVAVWLVSVVSGGGVHGAWPGWVVVPWGLVLLSRTVGRRRPRRLPGPDTDREPPRR